MEKEKTKLEDTLPSSTSRVFIRKHKSNASQQYHHLANKCKHIDNSWEMKLIFLENKFKEMSSGITNPVDWEIGVTKFTILGHLILSSFTFIFWITLIVTQSLKLKMAKKIHWRESVWEQGRLKGTCNGQMAVGKTRRVPNCRKF